ncbi:MAG: cell wall hydrolase, partial [[Eubacterium] rectale]|nr:cell wall hydrolase [Agathobacter rectalis]
ETTQGEAVSAGADDLTLLAAIIECEAGGESYECQLAVGAAVINRVKSSSYPNSISGVIYQKGQFGPASSGKLARKLSGSISSSCYSAAQEAMSGVDNTGGCTSFNDHGSGISIGNMKFR